MFSVVKRVLSEIKESYSPTSVGILAMQNNTSFCFAIVAVQDEYTVDGVSSGW